MRKPACSKALRGHWLDDKRPRTSITDRRYTIPLIQSVCFGNITKWRFHHVRGRRRLRQVHSSSAHRQAYPQGWLCVCVYPGARRHPDWQADSSDHPISAQPRHEPRDGNGTVFLRSYSTSASSRAACPGRRQDRLVGSFYGLDRRLSGLRAPKAGLVHPVAGPRDDSIVSTSFHVSSRHARRGRAGQSVPSQSPVGPRRIGKSPRRRIPCLSPTSPRGLLPVGEDGARPVHRHPRYRDASTSPSIDLEGTRPPATAASVGMRIPEKVRKSSRAVSYQLGGQWRRQWVATSFV